MMPKSTQSSAPRGRQRRKGVVVMRDIAGELGVSISIVSKVLNQRLGTSGVSPEMIEAIRNKATELNYLKNIQAEALRTGIQNVIGVCVHQHGTAGSMIVEKMVEGIAANANRHSLRLVLQYYQTAQEFRQFSATLTRNTVDGVIMGGIPHRELISDLNEINARGIPVVTIHDQELDRRFPNIGMDQSKVCHDATRHLVKQGCKRIAHFRLASKESVISAMRYQGYVNALREADLTSPRELLVEADNYYYESGLKAAQTLLERKTPFDGIVCQSDQHAMAAINTLMTCGRQIPQQVKVIGVDNAPFCSLAIVPFSSVSQEFFIRGELALEKLLNLMHGQKAESILVTPVVHPRTSTRAQA